MQQLKLLIPLILFFISSCKISDRNQVKYYNKVSKEAPLDAIIVPGVPFENGNWSRTMKLRVYWAKYLYEHGMTKNIIFSGGAVYTKYAECKIMRLYALEFGIPDEHIFMDSLAEHSTENVYYGYWVAHDLGFKKVGLATDPFQAKSLRTFVKKLNRKYDTDMQLLPAIMDTIVQMPKTDPEIDYETAIGFRFVNITETQSTFYRLGGTLGLHCDWENRPLQESFGK